MLPFAPFPPLPPSLTATIYLRVSTFWGTLLLKGVQFQSFRVGVLLLFHLLKPLLVLIGRTHLIQVIIRAWPKKSQKTSGVRGPGGLGSCCTNRVTVDGLQRWHQSSTCLCQELLSVCHILKVVRREGNSLSLKGIVNCFTWSQFSG